MTDRRLKLHEILCSILGSRNVYFQPPESVKMKYPAIVYDLRDYSDRHANNKKYSSKRRYVVTIIDANPDTIIPEKLSELEYASFSRSFTSSDLNHYSYYLYY